jgi:hypothetical protein
MGLINQRIWQFVLANEDILKYLFNYDFKTQDMTEYMLTPKHYTNMTQYEINAIEHSDWLYKTTLSHAILIGVEQDDSVNAINDTAEVGVFCDDFSAIPYEFLRLEIRFRNETTDDYFKSYPEFHQALLKYEEGAKEHNIQLDMYHIYHNERGELFKEYFEW